MDPNPQYRLTGLTAKEEKTGEEAQGLLADGHEENWSERSDEEELDWEVETKSNPRRPWWKKSWPRLLAIALLVASTLGFIAHLVLVDRKHVKSSTTQAAQLRPEEDYILDANWNFKAEPITREYNWTIAEHELNPDGVYRPMFLINGMFPGPLIECNEGDEIVIHVHNRATNATSIHWHGLYQNGTNWMDGTTGVTQCPIAPGHDFTYRFNVSNQSGTYWYHSHMSVQASDGLVGPFVIHAREEEELQKIPYEVDRIVMVSDHYYDLSSSLMMEYLAPDAENSEPVPPSAVINGRNSRDCSTLPGRNCDSSSRTNAMFDLPSDHNTRLRFINVGAFAEFQIQIDEHEFYVSEVDGTDVMPQAIHRLNINPAQRYSVILVPPKQGKGLYWMRARMITHCFAYDNPELKEEVRGVIRYVTPQEFEPDLDFVTPDSKDWPEIIEVECRDLNTSNLSPVISIAAPEKADGQIRVRSTFQIRDWALSRGYLNESSSRVDVTSPSLHRAVARYGTDTFANPADALPAFGFNTALFSEKTELVYQTTGIRTIDILIQNFDDGNHPFHLHGYKFWQLAQGHGYPSPHILDGIDLSNPLRRDTASVEAFGWTLIRFTADNAGMWAFHCHIAWHSEAGLMMQFLTRVDEVAKWEMPKEGEGLCKAEGIERGMGPEDSIWFGTPAR